MGKSRKDYRVRSWTRIAASLTVNPRSARINPKSGRKVLPHSRIGPRKIVVM